MTQAAASGPVVFLATRNPGKIAEMRRILAEHVADVRVLGLDDVEHYAEPAETEPTFAGNALLKARAAVAATGLPSIADDSGICVDALNGMPGVLSARWAGVRGTGGRETADAANNELLLAQLSDVPDERRGARFVCAVALCLPGAGGPGGLGGDGETGGPAQVQGPTEHVVHGEMPGRVIRETRGSGGFGYDVLFCADGYDVTTAELPAGEKDAISHRGKALREIAPVVARVLAA